MSRRNATYWSKVGKTGVGETGVGEQGISPHTIDNLPYCIIYAHTIHAAIIAKQCKL